MRLTLTAAILTACAAAMPARAADPVSPACKLLTDAEAAQLLGHTAMLGDGGAESKGGSACTWTDSQTYYQIGVSIWSGEMLNGQTADAAFESQKESYSSIGKIEEVPGVGEKAFYVDSSLYFMKGAKMAIETVAGLDKDKAIEAGKLMAGHL